jgi:lysophospholipase L1-like esterase
MGADDECVIDLDGQGNPVYQDRWINMLDNMSPGDYLFVQFGINDGSTTCDRHVGEAQFQIEYGMMAEAAKERGAHPVFITPVSMIRCTGNTAVGSRGFIDATFHAGETYDVPVIDLHQLSVDLYNELGFCPLPSGHTDISATTPGEVGAFFCDDHTHFDTPGAEAIAQVITDALLDQDIPLGAYLR